MPRYIGGTFGYKNCDRPEWHTFEYTIHDEAQNEAEHVARLEKEAARKKEEPTTAGKYYRDSWHIILRYAGQRIDVATVFGKRKAEALLARLQLLDHRMDAESGDLAGPIRPDPDKQYGPRPEAG